jgi:alpha-L-rhamnosidase
VKASHKTMYGTVSSAWTLKDGRFELSIEVPANTRATVRLPKAQLANVTEAGKALANGNGITNTQQSGEYVIVDVGSGQYKFAYTIGK